MNKMLSLLLGTFAVAASLAATPKHEFSQQEMITNLHSIRQTYEAGYAPTDWKKTFCQWSLDKEMTKAENYIKANPDINLKDYQRLLKKVLFSTRDYHVHIHFYTTEVSRLPITVKSANNKYFITSIDRAKLPKAFYPIEVGDEVIKFAGKPVDYVVKELYEKGYHSAKETDQAMAEIELTQRKALLGTEVPKGPISITVKSKESGKLKNLVLKWEYYPERVKCSAPEMAKAKPNLRLMSEDYLNNRSQFPSSKYYSSDWLEHIHGAKLEHCDHPNELGSRNSYIPKLGTVVWESPDGCPINAYIYVNEKGKSIGYIRIPTYAYHLAESNRNIEELAQIIRYFNDTTEALVVDQLNNPGGNVFYLYSILSLLADKPMELPAEQFKITQEEVIDAIYENKLLELVQSDADAKEVFGADVAFGYPVTIELAKNYFEYNKFIIDQWNEGKRLTDFGYFFNMHYLKPRQDVHYKKPILMLVNELDFSCGDFAPATLQDNHRATIFGTRTSGAGGAVETVTHKNQFGIASYSLTVTIAERPNKQPIENLGITPDIQCPLTENDLQNNFVDYIRSVNKAVNEILH